MSSASYATEINSIFLYKFGALMSSTTLVGDRQNSINILPQVQEITIFESIFSPVIRCELAVIDYIGLFVNFPLSGEEVVVIEYTNVADGVTDKLFFAIENVGHINIADNNRAVGYVLKLVALESVANSLKRIQQSYRGNTVSVASKIFGEHINDVLEKTFPTFKKRNLLIEDNDNLPSTIVIPNLSPFSAIDMITSIAVSEKPETSTYLFFQNMKGFNIKTLQSLTQSNEARKFAFDNAYKYLSNEIREKTSSMNNEERLVSSIVVNKRHGNLEKLSLGYFNNVLVEINIAQKAIWCERTTTEDIPTISDNKLNTDSYRMFGEQIKDFDDESNRTKFIITTNKEHDNNFPVSRLRERWGKDLISKVALSQVDIQITIPGTNRFSSGDLFYLDIPEMHGFNKLQNDDLISGYFIITDIKQVITVGGIQTTVLRLNKDSYNTSIDRESRYEG